MRNYFVSCVVYVRGIGCPNYIYIPPASFVSAFGSNAAIDVYLHQLLYDSNVFPHLQNAYLIKPYAERISSVAHNHTAASLLE